MVGIKVYSASPPPVPPQGISYYMQAKRSVTITCLIIHQRLVNYIMLPLCCILQYHRWYFFRLAYNILCFNLDADNIIVYFLDYRGENID